MSCQVTEKATLLPAVPEEQNGAASVLAFGPTGVLDTMDYYNQRDVQWQYDVPGNWEYYRVRDPPATIPGSMQTRFEHTRTHNPANQITGFSNTTEPVTHDPAGNLTASSPAPGSDGNIYWDDSLLYQWDAWNRLIKITHAQTAAVIATHAYDGLTRRTTLTENGVTRHFYYNDQWRSVEERLGDATVPERQHLFNPLNRWHLILRDRNSNPPPSDSSSSSSSSSGSSSSSTDETLDERLYCLHDAMDPVAIAEPDGDVVERYNYSAFGMRRVMDAAFTDRENCSAFAWNWDFHGEFSDGASGLHNYGHRYFNTGTGVWISRDPLEEAIGCQLYQFLLNNWVNHIDYLGLATEPLPATDIQYSPGKPVPQDTAPADCVCGADITDWFAAEVDSQKAAWGYYKRDYNTRNGSNPGYFQFAWWSFNNHHYKTADSTFAPSPTMTPPEFNKGVIDSKGRSCGKNDFCGNTVTLCGKCLHKSVLGNLMFGMMLKGGFKFQVERRCVRGLGMLVTWWWSMGLGSGTDPQVGFRRRPWPRRPSRAQRGQGAARRPERPRTAAGAARGAQSRYAAALRCSCAISSGVR